MKTLLILLALAFTIVACRLNAQVYIRTNLVGYQLNDYKNAIAFTDHDLSGNFNVVDASGKTTFTGPILPSKAPGYGPFKNYYELDFSKMAVSGSYQIKLPGQTAVGSTLIVGSNLYQSLPDVLLQFMRQQRCGYNPFFDQVCHQKDGRVMGGPMPDSTYIDVRRGLA